MLARRYEPWELCMLYSNESVKHFTAGSVRACLSQQQQLARNIKQKVARPAAPAQGQFFCRLGHVYHK